MFSALSVPLTQSLRWSYPLADVMIAKRACAVIALPVLRTGGANDEVGLVDKRKALLRAYVLEIAGQMRGSS